jgi:transcription initiation factor TFIID subunit TAF12
MSFDREMQAALEADGEKLRQLPGKDHGPLFLLDTVTREQVYSNLDDAVANGYDVRDWSVEDIVADLLAFAEDCENSSPEGLKPHVEAWLKERNT